MVDSLYNGWVTASLVSTPTRSNCPHLCQPTKVPGFSKYYPWGGTSHPLMRTVEFPIHESYNMCVFFPACFAQHASSPSQIHIFPFDYRVLVHCKDIPWLIYLFLSWRVNFWGVDSVFPLNSAAGSAVWIQIIRPVWQMLWPTVSCLTGPHENFLWLNYLCFSLTGTCCKMKA